MLISQHGFHAFTDYDLDGTLRNFSEKLRKEIESDSSVATTDEEQYVRQKVEEKTLSGLEFDTANITITHHEEQIPARYFGSGFMVDEGHSYPKQVITFHVPFKGDSQLLRCRASTWGMVSHEIDTKDGHVVFDVINFSNDADQVAKERDGVVKYLTDQAGYINRDVAAYNSRLESIVREALKSAKLKFKDQSDFLGKLGNKPKNG